MTVQQASPSTPATSVSSGIIPGTPQPASSQSVASSVPGTPTSGGGRMNSMGDLIANIETSAGLTNIHIQYVKKAKIWWRGRPVELE